MDTDAPSAPHGTGGVQYKTTYSRGSMLGKRRSIIPEDKRFRFRAYGFPKAPMNVPKEQRGQMPTQHDINALVDQCADVPITTDHGAWEVIHRANGGSERVCKRAPSIVGHVTGAFIDNEGRLVLDCELEASFYGMSEAQKISSGDKKDVSLGLLTDMDPETGKTTFTLDHVALVAQGRAKGTHIVEASCSAMPGLSFYGREFGVDPMRDPLAARMYQLLQRQRAVTNARVAQTQKSPHDTLAKKTNSISLYSSAAEHQPLVVSECREPQPPVQSSSAPSDAHCSPCATPTSSVTTVGQQSTTVKSSYSAHPSTPHLNRLLLAMNTASAATPTPAPAAAAEVAAAPAAVAAPAVDAPAPAAAQATPAAPISAAALTSALAPGTQPADGNAAAAPVDAPDLAVFMKQLMENTAMKDDEKLLHVGEKLLEQTNLTAQMQQELQNLQELVAQHNLEKDTASRQKIDDQVQLMEQLLEADPTNVAFANTGVDKNVLNTVKQLTAKLPMNERNDLAKYHQAIAAFGMNSQVTETFEAQQSSNSASQQDEMSRLRQQAQEAQERAAMLERQQRQRDLVERFANVKMPVRSAPMSASSFSSNNASCGSSASAAQRPSLFNSAAPMAAAGAAMFGASPAVSSRMSEESFVAAATGTAKRAADTSNDAVEQPTKLGQPVMGSLSNQKALWEQKANAYYQKQALLKKGKKL